MLFNSLAFAILVIATMALFYFPSLRKLQTPILILSSFIFYAANEPVLLLLLMLSIAINAVFSYLVYHGTTRYRTVYASTGVFFNLGVLAFFKYSPLFATSFLPWGSSLGEFLVAIPLPIGISFFTFQGITLLIDTLRNEEHRASFILPHSSFYEHLLTTTLYVGFFPQLVAGPIVKAHDFIPQIQTKSIRQIDWEYCFRHLISGYFLKMVVADNLDDLTLFITYPYFEAFGSATLLSLLFGYSMQIFADFAGYSLIAIGIAGLFGYRLPENFNFPYISRSISEFWRRWHISLSSFLKEYLYFPLGGNKKGARRTYLNLMVVMLLGGLWHGAAWSYMVWGGVHGLALAIERFFSNRVSLPDNAVVNAIQMLFVFVFVTFAWLLFRLPEFSQAILFLKSMWVNGNSGEWPSLILIISIYSLPVILYHLHYSYRYKFSAYKHIIDPVTYGAMLFLIATNSGSAEEFVYFQF